MRFSYILLIVCLTMPFLASAATIRCNNPDYAGKELKFYALSDPITGNKEMLFQLNIDNKGFCSKDVKIKKTTHAFSEFGIYKGMLLLEPGKTIDLKLPPLREKTFANEKNPYFSPVSFWFISEQKNHLNDRISAFEQELNTQLDKNFNRLYMQQSESIFDSVLLRLDQSFPEQDPKAFAYHKQLKIQLIEAEIFRLRPEKYAAVFASVTSEFWLHPAFIALLDKTFDEQLSFEAKAIGGREVSRLVNEQNINGLLANVQTKYNISGEISSLILLKLLHDAFYSRDFSKTAIKNMISNDLFSKSSNTIIRIAAKNILDKVSFLLVGTAAPEICLPNLEEQKVCTNRGTEKFKYIVFADVETAVCKEHLKYLNRIHELFNKHLEIFVVLRSTGREEIEDFFADQKIQAEKLIDTGNQNSVKYKIRSYPQCFLFDEQHKVVFSDARSPLDGFEQQFGTWLRNELFMRQRNQSR